MKKQLMALALATSMVLPTTTIFAQPEQYVTEDSKVLDEERNYTFADYKKDIKARIEKIKNPDIKKEYMDRFNKLQNVTEAGSLNFDAGFELEYQEGLIKEDEVNDLSEVGVHPEFKKGLIRYVQNIKDQRLRLLYTKKIKEAGFVEQIEEIFYEAYQVLKAEGNPDVIFDLDHVDGEYIRLVESYDDDFLINYWGFQPDVLTKIRKIPDADVRIKFFKKYNDSGLYAKRFIFFEQLDEYIAEHKLENAPSSFKESEELSFAKAVLNSLTQIEVANTLLTKTPKTVAGIKNELQNIVKGSDEILKEAYKLILKKDNISKEDETEAILEVMRIRFKKEIKTEDDKQLALGIYRNLIKKDAANKLLNSTPNTIESISSELYDTVMESDRLMYEAIDVLK